jgi:hypothetical protein
VSAKLKVQLETPGQGKEAKKLNCENSFTVFTCKEAKNLKNI